MAAHGRRHQMPRIGGQPGLGSPRYAVEFGWPGLRTHPLEGFPYLVFYVEQTDHLDVLRVLQLRVRTAPTAGGFSALPRATRHAPSGEVLDELRADR